MKALQWGWIKTILLRRIEHVFSRAMSKIFIYQNLLFAVVGGKGGTTRYQVLEGNYFSHGWYKCIAPPFVPPAITAMIVLKNVCFVFSHVLLVFDTSLSPWHYIINEELKWFSMANMQRQKTSGGGKYFHRSVGLHGIASDSKGNEHLICALLLRVS